MTGEHHTAAGYLRFPHLHGELLCFVAEDDLWLAPLSGTHRAQRLTVDRTRAGPPRFSPDGSRIAFTSWRSLDAEVHLAHVDGGPARQLTHWGAPDTRVCGWTPEGDVLAVSSHSMPFSHLTWSYRLPCDGSPGVRLPWGPVRDIAVAELEGVRRTLLLTGKPPHEPASWKRYRGGATGRLWLHGDRLLPGVDGHLDSAMIVGSRIAFLSDHEGTGNLYSCLPDGSDLRRHTDHDGFYARHAATDGRRVIYQCAGELWLVDDFSYTGEPHRLDVRTGGPRAGRRPYQVPAAAHLDALAVDTTGRASAVGVRGSLYWLTHRDGPARTLTDTPGVRVRLPEMLGDTGRIVYVTDVEGEDALEIADLPQVPRNRPPLRFAAGELGRVRELVSSPDGSVLAVAAHDGRLLLVRIHATQVVVSELIRSLNGPVSDVAFAPDSSWITWAHPGIGRSLSQIKIARIVGEERLVVDVTDGRFEDEQPVFTRDGRYLAFLSWRGFDPVYDVHTGDLSFPVGCRPHLVPLASHTPSPFALSPDGRPAAGGLDPLDDGGDGSVRVEPDGLPLRVTPFPVTASKYASLQPVAGGGLVWLRFPIAGALGETFADPDDTSGQPTLEHFDLSKAHRTELTGDVDWFGVSVDGTRLVINDGGELRAVPADEVAESSTTTHIDLRRVLHTVYPAAEWHQAYAEAGRLIRQNFWDPGMCGIDWDEVLARYRPLVERVAAPDDFADLLREVLGELGTSHAYVSAARRDEGPPHYQRAIGLLGTDFARTPDGRWLVSRILPGDSSDPKARSPLAGSGVREGAVLTHVDGRPVDPVAGPTPLLTGAGGTTVELTFTQPEPQPEQPPEQPPESRSEARSGPETEPQPAPESPEPQSAAPQPGGAGGPAPLRVAVVPLIDDRQLRYQDWVTRRRAVVRELSGGRCGYLHIPDMGGSGWAQFNRDLRLEVSYPALIVDVRGNAGGHISELVIEKLTRTILGWDLTRYAQPVSYTSDAPRGPVVAVADEMTASDGDMITAAFRLLGLGPVVGTRTWGGVVGMTGRHRLVDGTVITVPMNAAWFDAEGWGWSVENHGVEPDIEALRDPLSWAEGRHVALETAVHEALGRLAEHPAAAPPQGLNAPAPDRRRPTLPPRYR